MEKLEEKRKNLSSAIMFVSFDLVNCTLYKSKYKGAWVDGVGHVLEYITQVFIDSSIGGYQFWKMLGDEVVYTRPVQKIKDAADVVAEVYDAVEKINEKIAAAQIGDAQTAKILSVKATVWIADISPANLRADNVCVEYPVGKDVTYKEYLGTDIDGGFRIAQFTSSNRVVISADLAALLMGEESSKAIFRKIHFVGYRVLKGIWNGEPYPIFMYHGSEQVSFAESIVEKKGGNKPILMEYIEDLPNRVVGEGFVSYEEQLLTTLYRESGMYKEVEQLKEIIKG